MLKMSQGADWRQSTPGMFSTECNPPTPPPHTHKPEVSTPAKLGGGSVASSRARLSTGASATK